MKLFHSCTIEGLGSFFESYYEDLEICTSSENSSELFGRNCVIVLDVNECHITEREDFDIDAQKNYGYDEIRIQMTEDEFKSSVVEIIYPDYFDSFIEEMEELEEGEFSESVMDFAETELGDIDLTLEETALYLYDMLVWGEGLPVTPRRAGNTEYSPEFLNFD